MFPPTAEVPGLISMTMKASGSGRLHSYSMFDGKLANSRGVAVRLTVAEVSAASYEAEVPATYTQCVCSHGVHLPLSRIFYFFCMFVSEMLLVFLFDSS